MKYKVTRPKSDLHASVCLPASKSISNRLLIIHALSGQVDKINNLSDSDDTELMTNALASDDLQKDIGHAGTSMRFLTAYYSCRPGKVVMTGSSRMKERPIGPLVDALRLLGAKIRYTENEGFPPMEIQGKVLQGGEISIESGISSQFISALLMIAPYLEKGLVLNLEGESVSSSYIKMTLELMSEYGAECNWGGKQISIAPGRYKSGEYGVESDWSAASYWYAMTLIEDAFSVSLSYLKKNSIQGDSALVNIFHGLGIMSEYDKQRVSLTKLANNHPGVFKYDFTNSPDIAQSMAVALCLAKIPFLFTGTKTLRIKETDRIQALQIELKKLGYLLDSDEGGTFLSWNNKTCSAEKNPVIETYHDHRMAMAFAAVALQRGSISINDPMVVTKSYPAFWEDLKKAGFIVE